MSLSHLFCTAYLCVSLAFLAQTPDSKEVPESKGTIEEGNTYHNSALQMKISLPGTWHFFDRTMYSAPESKQNVRVRSVAMPKLMSLCKRTRRSSTQYS